MNAQASQWRRADARTTKKPDTVRTSREADFPSERDIQRSGTPKKLDLAFLLNHSKALVQCLQCHPSKYRPDGPCQPVEF